MYIIKDKRDIMDELDFLSELRCGEERRDASASIRGFLYQDYLALDLLLSETGNICLEFIEDICFFSKNKVCFYQVKYFPKSDLKSLEISKTLFYQYIRSQMIDKKSVIVKQLEICLFYYLNKEIEFVSDKFEKHMNKEFPESKEIINDEDLIDKINQMKTMKEREELLFSNRSNKYIKDFFKIIKFVKKEDFQNIKSNITENMKSIIMYENSFLLNEENILDIMFSLGLSMIRERYCLDSDNDIEKRIINQDIF